MDHVAKIERFMKEDGMGEMAAINRYLAQKYVAETYRSRRPLQSTNWLK